MENELWKDYKRISARTNELREMEYQPLEQSESDVRELIHDVLQEVQFRENLKAKKQT